MEISAASIKRLREETGAGVLDCRKALEACGGDAEKAKAWLKEKGLASAAKKTDRVAADGLVGSYIRIVGATTAGNNGLFLVTAVPGPTQITYNNLGATEAFTGTWRIDGFAADQTALTVVDGSVFPTLNYYVVIGEGLQQAETRRVVARSTNSLQLAVATMYRHAAGETVAVYNGSPEEVFFTSRTTGGPERLNFSPSITFDYPHYRAGAGGPYTGESIVQSTQIAIPNKYGSDYPFYLPTRWQDRFEAILDLARAAGVQVVIVSDR